MTNGARRANLDRRERRGRWAAVLGIMLLVAGACLIGYGMVPAAPESAPLPVPFVAGPDDHRDAHRDAPAMKSNTLAIPSLDISAPMTAGAVVGDAQHRTLQIPSDPARLTLFSEGATPCDTEGTVLVAGHVSSYGVHGALWPLSQIRPHAAVYMTCEDGTRTEWDVVAVYVTPKADLPQDIFTSTGRLRAVIVTCGGPVMADGHYRDNVRVELDRVNPAPEPGVHG